MKENLKYIIFILLLPNFCTAQKTSKSYYFSSEIEANLTKDSTTRNYQHYAIDFAVIGDYKKVLLTDEKSSLKYKSLKRQKIKLDSSFFEYKPVNALKEILKLAESNQIIIINEAHYSAQNRVFTTLLLQALFKKGYQTLFVEGLHPQHNKKLKENTYPLISSGAYFNEPQYGNLVRTALHKGIQVIPYDHDHEEKLEDPMKRWYSREEGQADNVLDFLETHPKEKLVIHCGYGHLSEEIHEGEFIGNMAAILKKKSGINPLTINQVDWLETHSIATANPYRVHIDINPPKEVSIFKNLDGKYFSMKPNKQDINIYFPPTKYIMGRPDWLIKGTTRRLVMPPFSEINIKYPYLVFAYAEHDDEKIATPIDVIEITNPTQKKGLVLEKGKFKIFIKDKNGKFQKLKLQVK